MVFKNLVKSGLEALLGRRTLWLVGRSLYLKARAETLNEPEVNGELMVQRQLLKHFLATKEKLVVFDVGANIGNWLLPLLHEARRLGIEQQIELHAFEPVPTTMQVLRDNVLASGADKRVHLVPLALSDQDGSAEMFITGETDGTNSLHADAMHRNQQKIRIEKTTVCNYRDNAGLRTIHFLKCDTEGHDMDVIRGAEVLFAEGSILALQFEYNIRWVYSRHFLKDVFDLLEGTMYRVGKITPEHVELYDAWHPELERFWEGNYLILHPDALQWFRTVSGSFDESFIYRVVPA